MALENSAWKRRLRKIVLGLLGLLLLALLARLFSHVVVFECYVSRIVSFKSCLPNIEIVCLSKTDDNRVVRVVR